MRDGHLSSGKVGIVYRNEFPEEVLWDSDLDRPYWSYGSWCCRNMYIPHIHPKDNPWARIDPLAMLGNELRDWWKV